MYKTYNKAFVWQKAGAMPLSLIPIRRDILLQVQKWQDDGVVSAQVYELLLISFIGIELPG